MEDGTSDFTLYSDPEEVEEEKEVPQYDPPSKLELLNQTSMEDYHRRMALAKSRYEISRDRKTYEQDKEAARKILEMEFQDNKESLVTFQSENQIKITGIDGFSHHYAKVADRVLAHQLKFAEKYSGQQKEAILGQAKMDYHLSMKDAESMNKREAVREVAEARRMRIASQREYARRQLALHESHYRNIKRKNEIEEARKRYQDEYQMRKQNKAIERQKQGLPTDLAWEKSYEAYYWRTVGLLLKRMNED